MSYLSQIDWEASTALSAPPIVHYRLDDGTIGVHTKVAARARDLAGKSNLRARVHDEMMTYDSSTRDSLGAFLVGELERLDPKLHEPLVSVTWSRDVDLREDVTIADEQSSFTNSSFAATGGLVPNGKAWVGKTVNAIPGIALDIGKTLNPLHLWAMELSWTLPELESAKKLQRPVDTQKYNAMMLKWQMDIDEMVYTGDSQLGYTGMLNSSVVTPVNAAATGAGSSTLWVNKTPTQILMDINAALNSAWTASGWAIVPDRMRLPPVQYSYLISTLISTAGNQSVMQFLKQNSLSNASNNQELDIQPIKWLTGRGAAGSDRMFVYTKDMDRIRYPLVPLQRTQLENRSLYQLTTYFGRLGVVEIVYPETMGYVDGV